MAEKFNKSHKAIVQKIESLTKELEFCFKLSRFAYFEKSSYVDDWNRTQVMYLVNRDGLLLLTSGFAGTDALQWKVMYLEAFNAMEKSLTSTKPA